MQMRTGCASFFVGQMALRYHSKQTVCIPIGDKQCGCSDACVILTSSAFLLRFSKTPQKVLVRDTLRPARKLFCIYDFVIHSFQCFLLQKIGLISLLICLQCKIIYLFLNRVVFE